MLAAGAAAPDSAAFARGKRHVSGHTPPQSSIVLEAASGRTLLENRADELRHPASLTKMMTLALVFDALKRGDLKLDQAIPVSDNAASRPPTKLCSGYSACGTITVDNAIRALVVKSANDIAVALAEELAGSEEAFSRQMTAKAAALGMARTNFTNANGLPNPAQVTTARDMATLSRHLIRDHSAYYHYFSLKRFTFRGRVVGGHNNLMNRYRGMDGLKTGFIVASGFNLAASAVRNGERVIGVFFGGISAAVRDNALARLMDRGFSSLGLSSADGGVQNGPVYKPHSHRHSHPPSSRRGHHHRRPHR